MFPSLRGPSVRLSGSPKSYYVLISTRASVDFAVPASKAPEKSGLTRHTLGSYREGWLVRVVYHEILVLMSHERMSCPG
jgi:hypothetical protein